MIGVQTCALPICFPVTIRHGVFIDSKDIGKYWQETYEFDGKSKTYYFDSGKLFAYEDVV